MSWNIGFSRNLVLKLEKKLGLFHIVLQEKSQKNSLTVLESQNLPKLQELDTESQISQFDWTLHYGRRKVFLSYRSDIKKMDLIEYRRKGKIWKNNQNFQLEKESMIIWLILSPLSLYLFYVGSKHKFERNGPKISFWVSNCIRKFLYGSKIFRLHAILHDAAGSVKSTIYKGPGYCYVLPCFLCHVTGLFFCLYVKIFASSVYALLDG